jgi:PAS domain S-box-containing protein
MVLEQIPFAAVLEQLNEGVSIADEAGFLVYTNAAEDELFGYGRGELIGQHVTVQNAYPRELNERRVGEVLEHLRTRGVWEGEWLNRRKDGSSFISNSRITGLEIDGKQHWLCVRKDVTEAQRAQQVLRESEERYRSLVQATAAIVWNTPASGEFGGEQPDWAAFTGQTRAEYAGTGWLDAVHPEDRKKTMAAWTTALSRREMYEVEHRIRRHDGKYRHMLARSVPVVESDGNVREWVGVHADVTAERELQQQLAVEREQLRDIFTRAPAFIATTRGPEHVFEFANPLFELLVGNRDLVGKRVREALPEVEGQGFFELLDNVYRTGEPFSGSALPIRLDRGAGPEELFVSFVYEPIYSGNEISGIFAHGNDVTEHVRAQRALERALDALQYQSQLNKTITDNAASCLFMMDERGHPTFMNPAAEEVTGYRLDEIRDAPLHLAVHHHHPDGRPYPITDCPIDNGREQLVPLKDYRDVFVRKDGTFFPVSCYVAPLERDGRTLGAVLEFRDITDDLRAQDALRDADRRKDEFLATLSHELRTPLTAILGWAKLLQLGGNDEATVRNGINAIEKSARVQAQIVEDVLDLSRIISGKIHVESAVVNVSGVAAQSLEGIQLAAAAKDIRVTSDLAPADEVLILGDANRLQQILWNLLTNAIKFTPNGGAVELRVAAVDGSVEISVRDSGIGIRPDFLPNVFDAFRQAEPTTTRLYGGLGLGLSIVRHLVQLHGGTVSAFSAGEDQGATFTIELPRLRRAPLPATTAETMSADDDLADLTGISVLVIDDQESVRDYMSAVIRKCGGAVRTASDVQQAIWFVQDQLPDVILCDIAMPTADGYAFLEWMCSIPWPRRVPVVAVTAFGRAEDRERVLEAGFDAYVRKPIRPGELSNAIAGAKR